MILVLNSIVRAPELLSGCETAQRTVNKRQGSDAGKDKTSEDGSSYAHVLAIQGGHLSALPKEFSIICHVHAKLQKTKGVIRRYSGCYVPVACSSKLMFSQWNWK